MLSMVVRQIRSLRSMPFGMPELGPAIRDFQKRAFGSWAIYIKTVAGLISRPSYIKLYGDRVLAFAPPILCEEPYSELPIEASSVTTLIGLCSSIWPWMGIAIVDNKQRRLV